MDTYPFLTELPTKDVMEDILKRYIDCIIFEIKEIKQDEPILIYEILS